VNPFRRFENAAVAAWGVAYVLVGLALATAIAWPVYESVRIVVIAAAGFAIAAALLALGHRFRWPAWQIAIFTLLAFVLVVVPLAVPLGLSGFPAFVRAVRDGVAGIVLGWKQLLTLSLPLGEYQAVLVPWLVVALVGTITALALATRTGRASAFAAPVVIAMGAFGLIFGSSATGSPLTIGIFTIPAPREVLLGVALVAVSLGWLMGRTRLIRARALRAARARTGTVRQRRESFAVGLRRNSLAVILVLVALGAGLVVTPMAAALGTRHALRDTVDPVLVVRAQASPLSEYRAWFDDVAYSSSLFTVTGDTDAVDRIRVATLDSYDGETFHVSGAGPNEASRFSRLPRTEPSSASDAELTITINDGYSAIWMPLPDGISAAPTFLGSRAETLADGFYINESGGTGIDVATTSAGLVGLTSGDSYRVFARSTSAGVTLEGTTGGTSLLEDSHFPVIVDWVKAQRVPRSGDGLLELISRLRARGYVSHSTLPIPEGSTVRPAWAQGFNEGFAVTPAYSGHSRARIEQLFDQLLTRERKAGVGADASQLVAGIGDDEQFATAAALLARYYGFESRVVLGVRLATDDASPSIATCAEVCTGSTMSAWIEVRSQGGTWVEIDTSPQAVVNPQTISEGIELPKNPTKPEEAKSDVISPPDLERNNDDVANTDPPGAVPWLMALIPILRAVGLGLLTIVLLTLPALVIAIAKRSRYNHRKRANIAEVSVVGSWDELVDLYVDLGIPMPQAATRLELAEASDRPGTIALAQEVDSAVFAARAPLSDASDRSWALFESERAELLADRTLAQRLRVRLSLASLIRYVDPGSMLASVVTVFRRK
jgi:hypothetical protein